MGERGFTVDPIMLVGEDRVDLFIFVRERWLVQVQLRRMVGVVKRRVAVAVAAEESP